MTLAELTKMRRLRARPAFPIVLTDDERVHEFCAANDLPTMWIPGLEGKDISPLHGLAVWIILVGGYRELAERVKEHRPESLWVTGYFGFRYAIDKAIGRPTWN